MLFAVVVSDLALGGALITEELGALAVKLEGKGFHNSAVARLAIPPNDSRRRRLRGGL